jgi:hypothetical protein
MAGATAVVDTTPLGYYTASSMYRAGLPTGFIAKPATLSHRELAQLHQDCVTRINAYRTGQLRFSNGTADPGVPKPVLARLMGNEVCSNEQALGSLVINAGAGGCQGAHMPSSACPTAGGGGQNTCCARRGTTYAAIQSQLYSCLQQMWDEGIGLSDNASFTQANGHWFNMRNSRLTQVFCGFAFTSGGTVWMNQDFSGTRPSQVPATCTCSAAGAADGCGRTCVAP